MKIKGIFITKTQTKKGSYLYNFLTRDNDNQVVIRVLSQSEYALNKEVELDLNIFDFRKIYFEKK
jgi:hypothetical protein